MSHISKIELEIQSLEDLKLACKRLGFTFIKNQETYQWYGRWVGDSALPEGINIDDLGSVDIHFNQRYIAATNTKDKYDDANLS